MGLVTQEIEAPPEMGDVSGGHWYRFSEGVAVALIYWRGGPGTPDKDIILFDITSTIVGAGDGSKLLTLILDGCDKRGLTIACILEPGPWQVRHQAWLQRFGFAPVGRYRDSIEMVRVPGMKGSVATLVVPDSANPFK